MLLAGHFVPHPIAILAPVLLNIWNYDLTMDPGSIGGALVATLLWRFSSIRAVYAGRKMLAAEASSYELAEHATTGALTPVSGSWVTRWHAGELPIVNRHGDIEIRQFGSTV